MSYAELGSIGDRGAAARPANAAFKMLLCTVLLAGLCACSALKISLFPEHHEKLQEFTLDGKGSARVLVIPVRGMISDLPERSLLRSRPSTVEEIVSQLRKAKRDKRIKAVVLEINSPGGTTTASDILYREIGDFKKKSGAVVVVAMMDLATSGAYYISLPADWIVAHPTTVTGSVGVIFLRPQLTGFMNKLGLDVHTYKSGEAKDVGSPFRAVDAEETAILGQLVTDQGKRFLSLVVQNRHISPATATAVATARIYSASEALQLGLIDAIGYVPDALNKAKSLAGLPEDARVVVYRHTEYPDDNVYNTATSASEGPNSWLAEGQVLESLVPHAGFYYLWMPPEFGRNY